MNKVKSNYISMIFSIVTTIFVIFLVLFIIPKFIFINCCMCGNTDNNCCPCPNENIIKEVEDYNGYHASSAGSWYEMCNKYLTENNITGVDCFE